MNTIICNGKTFTHKGVLVGADRRTSASYKRTVLLRKTAKFWITRSMSRFLRGEGIFEGRGTGEWPLYHLDISTVRELTEEDLKKLHE
jgi:hypothetical protein